MFELVGLGNPGQKYALNRHNIGFMAVDSLAAAYHFPPFKIKFSAMVSEGTIGRHKVLLCKPMTYMNLSGQPAGDLIRFYKIPPASVYVVHDDLDLEPGQIKLKIGGGNGGHNGLKSLDQHISPAYWRLRLGIGHPGRTSLQKDRVTDYVLSNFSRNDEEWLTSVLRAITEEADTLFGCDPGAWLTRIAQNLRR
ncbi:MAG: aminoacyl-tRNA hydrolase [Alphaproteobacteria bacterium]|jgi:PTH1 family peptidyl-tRNA hydrolase|nr:aminoacyl-tRNA hydrolase [Alphaproteobacteria bacterium]